MNPNWIKHRDSLRWASSVFRRIGWAALVLATLALVVPFVRSSTGTDLSLGLFTVLLLASACLEFLGRCGDVLADMHEMSERAGEQGLR